MIRFLTGKPRAGKTKRAVIWLVEVLRSTNRPIVTNMAVELGPWVDGGGRARKGLLRTLHDKYGSTFDAERRIHFIRERDDVRRFYAVRPRVPRDDWEPVEVLRLPPPAEKGRFRFDADKYPSCVYFIDEAHVFFPAAGMQVDKEGMDISELLGYASQAGRCGDLVFLISQFAEMVNKKLRILSQECHVMVNHRHQMIGKFRQPDVISYCVFASTPPGDSEQWMTRGMLRYDKEEIEGSYNTGAGEGVSGNTQADIGRRAKGMPLWVVPVCIVVVAILSVYALKGIRGAVGRALAKSGPSGNVEPTTNGVSSTRIAELAPQQVVEVQSLIEQTVSRMLATSVVGRTELKITSVASVGGPAGVRIYLSDGSQVRLGDGRLSRYDARRRIATVDGREIGFSGQ